MATKKCVGILLPGTESYGYLHPHRSKPSAVKVGDQLIGSDLTITKVEHYGGIYHVTLSDDTCHKLEVIVHNQTNQA